jgi:hypothetical protein
MALRVNEWNENSRLGVAESGLRAMGVRVGLFDPIKGFSTVRAGFQAARRAGKLRTSGEGL